MRQKNNSIRSQKLKLVEPFLRESIAGAVFLLLPLLCSASLASEWQSFPLRENGTIPVWSVAGPFPNGLPLRHGPGCFGFYQDFLEAVGGEQHCIPAEGDSVHYDGPANVTWITELSNPEGLLDFIDVFGIDKETPGVVYSFCQIISPTTKTVLLKIRSNDGVRVWLGDTMVHENHVGRTVDEGGEDHVTVRLQQGNNRLLLKVDQSGGGWGQRVALEEADGSSFDGIEVRVQATTPIPGTIRSASFATTPLVSRTPQGERQMVNACILSGGLKDVVCEISKPEWPEEQTFHLGDLPIGKHSLELQVPVITEDSPVQISLESSTDSLTLRDVPFRKPREWTIYLVQHTHTDIGYTRPQHELMPAFLKQIDYALEYCDLTDDYPEDAKFRWTCEVSWPVREYLRRRPPEQIERLKKRVEEGRIEVTGLYLNMDELADESVTAASLRPIQEFRDHGLSVTTAMQNDVPGVAWCLVDYFNDIDVKYLIMGINNDRTPRPFTRPTAFWWESPSGKRVLAWRPDHYHTGNHLRLHQGNIESLKLKTLDYLKTLADKDYPYDRISAQYSGMQIDNSPPAVAECDLIREWNEKHIWPRLRSATAREFPEYVEEQHSDELPVYRGAWPNWWTDGFAFAHVETAEARRAHVDFNVAQGLLSIAALLGAELPDSIGADIEDIQDDLLFYDEHTFGAQEEFSHPMAENSIVQWGEKVSHIWEAVKNCALLRETAWGALQSYIPRERVPTIAVFNTLTWSRSGPVDVYIGHEILSPGQSSRMIDVISGEAVPAEVSWSRFEGSYWTLWVEDVPPMGYKLLRIEVGEEEEAHTSEPLPPAIVLENSFYRLEIDQTSGAISSLVDKESGRELVDQDSSLGLGEFICDRLTDYHFYDRESFLERSTRTSLRNVKVENIVEGPIWKSLRIAADADGCESTEETPGVQCELRLYHRQKKLEIQFKIRKLFVAQPESVYVAFPFGSHDGAIAYDAQGGTVTPGDNQLPGSSSDWHTVQNVVSIRDDTGQILLSSDEIPLVQFGDINMGKWQYIAEVERPHVFSWVMNNYWTYNFRGSKESEFTWRYWLTSTGDTTNTSATRFGWECRTHLVARVLPPRITKEGALSFTTLRLNAPNVLVLNTQPAPDGNGILLHLRELEGEQTEVQIQHPTRDISRIDTVSVLGETIEEGVPNLSLEPFETRFVKCVF